MLPRAFAAPAWQVAAMRSGSYWALGSRMFGSAGGPTASAGGAAAGPAAVAAGDASQQPGPGQGQSGTEEERAASLPVEQLAKALLAGNVRGQLTTIQAGEQGAEESKVFSTVVSYLSPRGEAPVVLLDPKGDAQHLINLEESGKASLATGHITPPWFIRRLRGTGWLPRRVALLGQLESLPPGEVKFAFDQAAKACTGAPGLAALLPRQDALPGLLGYRIRDISQTVYVDSAGKQQQVPPEEVDSCFLDPLALSQHDLLAELNQGDAWQSRLQLFCAAYLGVHCREVLLTEADRLGFTLLGSPALAGTAGTAGTAGGGGEGSAGPQRWRQFRIGSSRELRGRQQFMDLLEQMRAEVAAAAGAA